VNLIWKARGFSWDLSERPLVMGVLNVTPDSFSDPGRFFDAGVAVEHGLAMARAGADIIDVGGESTRPGSPAVSVEEQIRRAVPVVRELASRLEIPVSIDTTNSEVARMALSDGAAIINDVSGLAADFGLARLAAKTGAGLILMHMRGVPETMQSLTDYEDLLGDIRLQLREAMDKALAAGVEEDRIAVDPGIGFAKTAEQNVRVLVGLESLKELNRPILIGVSRKSFLGKITGRPVDDRLGETITATLFAAGRGANIHRVHDVAEAVAALKTRAVLKRIRKAGPRP